jgi:nitrate/nitrite transporter NarK
VLKASCRDSQIFTALWERVGNSWCGSLQFGRIANTAQMPVMVMTGLVGMAGGIGGFYLASRLGCSKQLTGSYQAGLFIFASLAVIAMIGLSMVKQRWRITWGSAVMTIAKI